MTRTYLLVCTVFAASVWGQRITDRRSAEIRGGDGDGKCTIEVVVDEVAEIEINGRNASIRTISGGPASFRRFQCNQEMPTRPNDFRFKGIDGRGRQDLVRQPGSGPAVIRIEDPKGGSEGYTFDIFWRGGTSGFGGGYNNNGRYNNNDRYNNGRYNDGRGRYNNGSNRYDNGGYNNGRYGNNNGYNGPVNFQGGRTGSGSYQDRNGNRRRLDSARVNISNSGRVDVSFDTDRGRLVFNGQVDRREGNRVLARVNGSGMSGVMEIELNNNNVRSINMSSARLSWSN